MKLTQPQLLFLQNKDLVPSSRIWGNAFEQKCCKDLEEAEEEEERVDSYKERRREEWKHHEVQVARRTAPSHSTVGKGHL